MNHSLRILITLIKMKAYVPMIQKSYYILINFSVLDIIHHKIQCPVIGISPLHWTPLIRFSLQVSLITGRDPVQGRCVFYARNRGGG